LEETDRYVTWVEAKKIAGLTDAELANVKSVLLKADQTITKAAANAELKNEDGKIELAFDDMRKIMVVDVLGTLDECRFTYNGVHVSKEVARQFYKKTAWYNDLEAAKKDGEAKGIQYWKALCKTQPPKLDQKLKTIISQMYMSVANEMSNIKLFNTPKLAKVIAEYQAYMGEKA
jgi:phosphoribosylaminoimidazole-succinocarboxamide synthase